jgi:putative ABC transport system permease protein
MIAGIGNHPAYQVYVPLAWGVSGAPGSTTTPTVLLTSRGEPMAQAASVRQEVRRLAPGVPVFEVFTMDEVLNRFYFAQRLWGQMFSVIAGLALLIAGVGAYGVTAYSMSQRTREMGIRIALGAHHGNLLALVVRQGLFLATVGIGVGLLGAVPLAHVMRSLLHDMSPFDPGVFASVVLLLLTVGWLASYLPARRVSAVDPITALRAE